MKKKKKVLLINRPDLKKKVKIGAKIKLKVLEFIGITDSFNNNFKPSAKGWSNPK